MLIISLVLLIIAITIHEFSHAITADKLGDPTPRALGRLSLNPLRHIDPLGLLSLIFFRFGWGKPVPIDSYNFSHPRRDEIFVSLAGPASNFILALMSSLLLNSFPLSNFLAFLLSRFIQLNVFLAIFNLLPIPPLDGSKIFFDMNVDQSTSQLTYILLLVLAFTGILSQIVVFLSSPIINLLI